MKKIKIFVAGAKDLSKEREAIKLLANDLNSKYHDKNVMLIIHSYENFNDNQDEYNRFIENNADIVIFILDGRIGDKTEEEFLKAADSYDRNQRPEIIVFLHEFDNLTGDIGRIQGLISAKLGNRYYVDYSGIDDLKAKARERIVRYIESGNTSDGDKNKFETHPLNSSSQSYSKRLRWLVIGLTTLVFLLACGLCWSMLWKRDILIFAGGGSVKNYIKDTQGVNIMDYPNSVYSNLASGSAWGLLTEEAFRDQEDGGKNKKHYSSVCLSADDIDSISFINEKTKGMFKGSRIIKYLMGHDSLVVYVHKDILKYRNYPLDAASISEDSLRSLIKYAVKNSDKINIFSTSKTSGTLRRYQTCFEPSDSIDLDKLLDRKQSHLFFPNSLSSFINALDEPIGNQPYIILGSMHYYPETIKKEDTPSYVPLFVLKDGSPVLKPINIYFLARQDGNDLENFKVDKPIIKFLKDIRADKRMDPPTWERLKNGEVKSAGGNLIISLN